MTQPTDSELRSRIEALLKGVDPSTLKLRELREKLEKEFSCDLTERKDFIKQVCTDVLSAQSDAAEPAPVSAPSSTKAEGSDVSSKAKEAPAPREKPPAKKARTTPANDAASSSGDEAENGGNESEKDDVHIFADSELRSLELGLRKRRAAPVKKPRDPTTKRKPTNSGLQKMQVLSPQLAAVLGVDKLPRTQVTKQIWEYIKAHNLQDPSDKRVIIADEKLQQVLPPRIQMFKMTKVLAAHMKGEDEVC